MAGCLGNSRFRTKHSVSNDADKQPEFDAHYFEQSVGELVLRVHRRALPYCLYPNRLRYPRRDDQARSQDRGDSSVQGHGCQGIKPRSCTADRRAAWRYNSLRRQRPVLSLNERIQTGLRLRSVRRGIPLGHVQCCRRRSTASSIPT